MKLDEIYLLSVVVSCGLMWHNQSVMQLLSMLSVENYQDRGQRGNLLRCC